MPAICGKIYRDRERKVEERAIQAMLQLQRHRGPDTQQCYLKDNLGVGHAGLKLTDTVEITQPLSNEDGSLVLVMDGEIFNHKELRAELEAKGHRFGSEIPDEVALHLFEEKKERCVEALRGVFAFAIWDEKNRQLFLAGDALATKPLYYAHLEDRFLFASEMKALLVDEKVKRKVDLASLIHFLTYQYVPHPRSILRDVNKLEPASYLIFSQNQVFTSRYWELQYQPKTKISEQDAVDQIKQHVDEVVRIRLETQVPVGCFLSGGLDSSGMVAFMRHHVSGRLSTFSIGFEEEPFNELPYARQVAERFETEHHEFIVKPETIKTLPTLVWHFDEPMADSSGLPTFHVARITSPYVKVVINGDGGDESFLGYERYLGFSAFRRYGKVPALLRWLIHQPVKLLYRMMPNSVFFEKGYYLGEVSFMDPYQIYMQMMLIFRTYMLERILSPELRFTLRQEKPLELMLSYLRKENAIAFVDKINFADISTYLPGALVPKMERMTMAHSLAVRAPLLDRKMMEFAATLPAELRFKNQTLKYLWKKVLEELLPREIVYRAKKGFGVPLGRWFQEELYEFTHELLLSSQAQQRGYFDHRYVKKLLDDHRSGRQNHHHRLWALLCFEVWCRTFLDRKEISSGPISL